MTWTWEITGLGTTSQTLTVYDDNGDEVASDTRDGWTWGDEHIGVDGYSYPDYVHNVVARHDLLAALTDDVRRL